MNMVPMPGKDYTLKLPKGYLSYSQLDTFLRCPMQYQFRYVAGRPSLTTSAAFEGTALAAALEAVGRRIMEGKYKPEVSFALKEHAAFLKKESSSVDRWDNGDDPKKLRERGEFFLASFFDQGHADQLKPVHVEHEFITQIAGVEVRGVADVVEPNYVFDFKVYKSLRFLNAEKSLQLSLYAHVFQKTRVGYIVFLKEGKKPIEIVTAERDLEKTRKWLEITVSNVAMSISNGSFAPCNPSENFLCHSQWCESFGECYGKAD